ncbi:MAG: Gfo/Idh/MocA family oxidoreductase [Verrucomicrobiota bacterium]
MKISRRNYLKTTAVAAASFALPCFSIGQSGRGANSKLNIGLVGGGGIAKTAFGDCRRENVIAIADVDQVAGSIGFNTFPDAQRYVDFRRMLDAHGDELDLVIVSTPDHTHFVATYAAMERGIAVHTQKPLTHNIWEARTLQAAADKFGVQTVMGNQGHNMEGMRLIREWYEAGLVGKVREVHAWTNRTSVNVKNEGTTPPPEPVPPTLDWELWQGPVPEAAYNKTFVPKGWRWWWQYGLGGLGDIGCHTLEIPTYAMQLGYPNLVYMAPEMDYRNEFDGKKSKAASATYVYEFPAQGSQPPVTIYWYEGGRLPRFPEEIEKSRVPLEGGCLMIGDKNILFSPGMRPSSPRLANDWMELRRQLPPKTLPRAVGGPVKEIIMAIKGEIPGCGSNFDYAAPLTETVILGTIAVRSGKNVEYLPDQMRFKDPSLDFYIREPVRSGWEYGEGLIRSGS